MPPPRPSAEERKSLSADIRVLPPSLPHHHHHQTLTRGLKSRHIQFLALGGALGTGLFLGAGSILATVGPAPLFTAYLATTLLVWTIMNALAEITAYLPLRGITLPYFVHRFVDPSLAFADGWNYWFAYAMLVATEVTAGGDCVGVLDGGGAGRGVDFGFAGGDSGAEFGVGGRFWGGGVLVCGREGGDGFGAGGFDLGVVFWGRAAA
ncbi:hypothetical protein EJ03DRAFT_383034 [Teratosphaeria nubilosa]|uniref:Amino acid permease/ SLC12A domain-containing protein n=1 Tax=Teratosphaeria nubilosa TaxID=161662 RepID=A0A6G1L8J4_9PEZI|nr:hypothetical protein EJ03DRAFT_383034 [Teratosphaeria nubilosa]